MWFCLVVTVTRPFFCFYPIFLVLFGSRLPYFCFTTFFVLYRKMAAFSSLFILKECFSCALYRLDHNFSHSNGPISIFLLRVRWWIFIKFTWIIALQCELIKKWEKSCSEIHRGNNFVGNCNHHRHYNINRNQPTIRHVFIMTSESSVRHISIMFFRPLSSSIRCVFSFCVRKKNWLFHKMYSARGHHEIIE